MPETPDQDDRARSARSDVADTRRTVVPDETQGETRAVRTAAEPTAVAGEHHAAATSAAPDRDRRVVQLGGIRWGAVFFGWLCATGVAVLLVALLAATGTAIGLTESNVDDVVEDAVSNAGAISLAGAIGVVVVLALSYLAGGYVAARMSRFSGRSQGFAVWVLGLVITLLVALAGAVLGTAYDVLARLDLPRIPVDEGAATTAGVITLLSVLLVTLLAAVLGGSLGDRYHRRLDEIDLR